MNHQAVFDSLNLPISVKLVPFQDYSPCTMYVDSSIPDTIFYKEKDWFLPMSSFELQRFVYDLYHEYMHVLQCNLNNPHKLVSEESGSPHPNYSSFNKAEEEAEAFALLMTQGVGCTKRYRWNSEDKVRWIFDMHKVIEEDYLVCLPVPAWAEQKYKEYLTYNTPPAF